MSLTSRLFAGVSGLVLAAAAVAVAAEKPTLKDDLGHYFPVRTALAEDKIEGIKEHADALGQSQDKVVAKAAKALAEAADVAAARKAFGDLSKALIADVDKAQKAKIDIGTVYVFECPMAKPYGRWLQESDQIGNPYYGSSMLKCGKQIAAVGAPAGEGKGGEHGGHKH